MLEILKVKIILRTLWGLCVKNRMGGRGWTWVDVGGCI